MSVDASVEAEPSPTTDAEADTGGSEAETSEEPGDLSDTGSFQPPEPAMTPGVVAEVVADVTQRTGLSEVSFLGLSGEDWVNLGLSLLIILTGYLIGAWVIRRLPPRAVRRTSTEFDDALLAAIGNEVRWLVVLFFLWFAIVRLVFLSVQFKTIMQSILYVMAFVIVLRTIWQSINVAETWGNRLTAEAEREDELAPVIKLLVMLSRILIFAVGISVLLAYFGIDVFVAAATLGVGG